MAQRILIVRNDKLGDFMLAWPAFALVKRNLPRCETWALVPAYTREMAEVCPWIDRVLVDPGEEGGWRGLVRLIRCLRASRPDAAIALYSTLRIGVATLAARIPYRLAPATKLAQLLYRRRLVQRRSRSLRPESAYNAELARAFLRDHGLSAPLEEPSPPYLSFDEREIAALRGRFLSERALSDGCRLIFLHPGSGGSARNLSLAQYAGLAAGLRSQGGHVVAVTAGPGEEAVARQLTARLAAEATAHTLFLSDRGLASFARHIAFADLFISGSTGPLHIAGALDRPTVAFYPRRRSATALRWQTLNAPSRRLAFAPPTSVGAEAMEAIDVDAAARAINAWMAQSAFAQGEGCFPHCHRDNLVSLA